MTVFGVCVACPGPLPAEPWQILGLGAVGLLMLAAFALVLLAFDRLSG